MKFAEGKLKISPRMVSISLPEGNLGDLSNFSPKLTAVKNGKFLPPSPIIIMKVGEGGKKGREKGRGKGKNVRDNEMGIERGKEKRNSD